MNSLIKDSKLAFSKIDTGLWTIIITGKNSLDRQKKQIEQ
jgi:hypothetical protein